MPKKRIYDEKEVIRIIERAIEHQHAEPNRKPGLGLTLDELEHLGAEVGIRPEHLQRAAVEVDLSAAPWVQSVSGGLYEVHTERWLPDPVSDAEVDEMFAEVKNRLGAALSSGSWWQKGDEVGHLGQSRWIQLDIEGATRITVTEQADGHVLRVSRSLMASKLSDSIILGTFLTMVLAIAPVGAAVEWLNIGWAILAGVLTLLFSITMTHQWTRWTRARTEQKVQEIADTAAHLLQASGKPSPAAVSDKARVEPGAVRQEPILPDWDDEDMPAAPPQAATRRAVR